MPVATFEIRALEANRAGCESSFVAPVCPREDAEAELDAPTYEADGTSTTTKAIVASTAVTARRGVRRRIVLAPSRRFATLHRPLATACDATPSRA
jgi:hypothetical protein